MAATMRAQYTFGPEVQSTNSASITYNSGTGAFQYADAALFSENHAALPLRGTAATFITTSNEWTASVTVNISARSMTVAEGTSCDVVMGLLLDFANSNDLVGIFLAQDNNTGGGDDSIYPDRWYGTAVRFAAYENKGVDVATPLGKSLSSSDGSVYVPLSAGTNAAAATESISTATGVLILTYNAQANTVTGYYNGTPVGRYSLAGWGSNPPLTLAVYGDSEVESVVVPPGTVTASNFYAGLLPSNMPQLAIVRSGTNVVLTWPTNTTGFNLQSTPNLVSPASWNTNLPSPVVVNGQNTVTNAISDTQNFYRLSQ